MITKPNLPPDTRPELLALLSPKGYITKPFCQLFLQLLPKCNHPELRKHSRYEAIAPGCTGDGDQDLAEGFALTGNWNEREGECQDIWAACQRFKLD